jgi:hypothetical protein
MMSVETLPPNYLSLSPWERGTSLNISFQTYRWLAVNALAITRDNPSFMGIYVTESGCCLDIFASTKCLTIKIDSRAQSLCLFLAENLDSPEVPTCILSIENSNAGWSQLTETAKFQLSH